MKISEVILERTKNNHSLDAFMKGAVSKISQHISSNSMIFFPEYTDHDITHFEAVLETAIDLTTDKSLELMTDTDLVVLTTSVMLHDLGMHLTKDGFETLISPQGPIKPIEGFSDPPWHELWSTFLAEARRFDAKKLESLLGPKYRPVTDFPLFDEPWDEFDILLVGEFLRRHHPRLAHEIALQGMPSKDGGTLRFCDVGTDEEQFLSDISGLVARSHGMSLRGTFEYLETKYSNKIETRSARPVYLMTLLRIADYLQIQSARAPSARTDVTKFKSPVSTREWSVHQCVTDITNLTDPEAIDITARPNNIETFLRLKFWISDLQRELDLSWAVLGEIFGLQSHSGLNKLGLRIRRLKSNIDDNKDFSKTVNYIPKQISFSTAENDLLKLLVGPLYAHDVSVGLRELIQNSTDAVKELDSLVDQSLIDPIKTRNDISADVQVEFSLENENESFWERKVTSITVTDRGVGMTPEIVQNYFLKAGASFRNSSAWKESFEEDDGVNRIQRSGRFGVGALAAFLLGDKIYVETRHYSEPQENGLQFSAGIETSSINITKFTCEVGTKIYIEVPKRLQKKIARILPHNHDPKVDQHKPIGQYFGRYPSLIYKINNSELEWDEDNLLPNRQSKFEDPWNYFETNEFDVNWTYQRGVLGLAVNQINITGRSSYGSSRSGDAGVEIDSHIFEEPSLSIGDNSGSFDLNLQRSEFAATELPFLKQLLSEVTDEFLFTCLWQLSNIQSGKHPRYAGFARRGPAHGEPRWLDCSDGILLNQPRFLKEYDPTFCFIRYGSVEDKMFFANIVKDLPERTIYFHDANDEFTGRKFKMKGKLKRTLGGKALNFVEKTTTNQSILVPTSFVSLIMEKMKPGIELKAILDNLKEDKISGWLQQLDEAVSEPERIQFWRNDLEVDGKEACVISLHNLSSQDFNAGDGSDDIVFDRWMELLGQPHLPRTKDESSKLLKMLSEKIGPKYLIFERRAKEAQAKIADQKDD